MKVDNWARSALQAKGSLCTRAGWSIGLVFLISAVLGSVGRSLTSSKYLVSLLLKEGRQAERVSIQIIYNVLKSGEKLDVNAMAYE